MARFTGEHQETLVVNAPIEKVKALFGTVDRIASTFGNLERWEKVDDKTLHLFLRPKAEQGASFKGHYQCRYEFTEPDLLEFHTVGEGNNMWSTGRAKFTALGPNRTQLEWWNRIETEIDVNRLLAKLVGPIASREIRNGVSRYLENIRKTAERG